MIITLSEFRKKIEYSLCQQFSSDDDVRQFCNGAIKAGVGVVCVNPVNVKLTAELIKGNNTLVSGNVGFPFGSHYTETKILETKRCIGDGATQIDMVINVGALRSKNDDLVYKDIKSVIDATDGYIVKAIIETWVLNDEEKKRASLIAEKAGAQIIKTSTGVRTQYIEKMGNNVIGAKVGDIVMMRKILKPSTKIKASGGIYNIEYALNLIKSGADQLGVSEGEELIQQFLERFGQQVEI